MAYSNRKKQEKANPNWRISDPLSRYFFKAACLLCTTNNYPRPHVSPANLRCETLDTVQLERRLRKRLLINRYMQKQMRQDYSIYTRWLVGFAKYTSGYSDRSTYQMHILTSNLQKSDPAVVDSRLDIEIIVRLIACQGPYPLSLPLLGLQAVNKVEGALTRNDRNTL